MKNIAIFCSGSGSNAENIFNYFAGRGDVKIALILTNKAEAYINERARKMNVPCHIFNRTELNNGEVLKVLHDYSTDYIVLAGFLLLFPKDIIAEYEGRIVNIHPALLPNYGGKGMYGDNVHRAVKEAGETESGITIHHVNEFFDSGDIIFQAKCEVLPTDTADDIAAKVHLLEYKHFPHVIDEQVQLINK